MTTPQAHRSAVSDVSALTTRPLLTCRALEVGYARQQALLPGIDLEICPGELWALVGPNGSGKTTFLKTLLGLLDPLGGVLGWHGDARIGYVPQRTRVDLTVPARVIDLVEQGVERSWSFLRPGFRKQRADAIERALHDTHTTELRHQRFATLSEGQKQRVLMARALANAPDIMVLDEPTSAMDMKAEHDVFTLIESLRHERELAVLLVSHHLPVVAEFASHVVLFDRECDAILSGPIEDIADHHTCRARYGRILREGMERRRQNLCALDAPHSHHDDDHTHHHHDHAHTHDDTHEVS